MSQQNAAVQQETGRIDPRFPASALPMITAVRLSPGDMVTLVNMSASGVLVQGKTRFVPGTRVTVNFEGGFKPPQVKGRVVRCQVSAIEGGSLQYQSGIQFEVRVEMPAQAEAAAPPKPEPRAEVPAAVEEIPAVHVEVAAPAVSKIVEFPRTANRW